jgi:hypothetical protein
MQSINSHKTKPGGEKTVERKITINIVIFLMVAMTSYGTYRKFDQNYFICQFNMVSRIFASLSKQDKDKK